MLSALLVGLGLLELLFPRQVVDAAIRLTVDVDGDVQPKPWLYSAARVEGATLVGLALWRHFCGSTDVDVEAETAA